MNNSRISGTAVPLALRAAAELEFRRREGESLYDFIPRISRGKGYGRPTHLAPLVDLFERFIAGEEINALVSVPPQHSKTETTLHAMAKKLRVAPHLSYGYVSYIEKVAAEKSLLCRGYAQRAGVRMSKTQASSTHWRTEAGGDFFATGIGGPLTSRPLSGALVVDDPFKNREECESLAERNRVEEWFDSTASVRVHPGASTIIIQTRWHEDDMIGRLRKYTRADGKTKRFVEINIPAIDPVTDAPLWPEKFSRDWYSEQRVKVKEHNWWSLYMGSPRPRGGELFKGVHYVSRDKLPGRYRIGKGLDLGYSGTQRSDASCGMVFLESGGDIYIVDRAYGRKKVPEFMLDLQRVNRTWPGPWTFLGSSLECKGIENMGDTCPRDVDIISIPCTTDKWQKAQPLAAAWNGLVDEFGRELAKPRVFILDDLPWAKDYIEEMAKFTGVGDVHDDQVDASAAAFWDFKELGAGTAIYLPKARRDGYRMGASRGMG